MAVFENQEVILMCDSVSDTEWFYNSFPWPHIQSPVYHKYARSILIDEVKQHDYGFYRCLGSFLDDDGQEKKMTSTVVLLVGGIILLQLNK